MDRKDKQFLSRVCRWLYLPLLTVVCLGCVEGDSGGTPVGESQYLIGPDEEVVYYRTPDGPDGFLQIDFSVASDAAVPDADVGSFELLPDSLLWARDADSVFFSGQLVPTADPSTIRLLGADGDASGWAGDDQQVYRVGAPVAGADPTTFEVFDEDTRWGRDRENVYYGSTVLDDSDPSSFELLGRAAEGWARDFANVYRDGEIVAGVDPATFVQLGAGYYNDKDALYYEGRAIAGANLSALQARAATYDDDANLAWDDSGLWFNGEPVTVRRSDGSTGTVDVSTLAATHTATVLADADGVYGRLIDHVDRPAFFYQIDFVNPAAFRGGATHNDDVLSFTLQTAEARSLGAYDASERVHSLLRFGVFEIAEGADVERLDCAYWRRGNRIFYYGVLVEGQAASGFSPREPNGECRTEVWLLDALEEFQE